MTEPNADNLAPDLAERMDQALEAFWRGRSDELERLIESQAGPGPRVGELFGGIFRAHAVPVTGLPGDAAVNGYRIIREISRGGMGVVYEAEQQEPRRRVALKVLGVLGPSEPQRRLFRREVQTLARLRHPALVTIYEAGQTEDGRQFFTMELIDGVPLDKYVRGGNVPVARRLELFARICEAVAYAHEHGVIHRDLKPANILIDADGDPHILDFGLARATGADVTGTVTIADLGKVMGTLGYMSPEQARGAGAEIDARSDVYALGVILYEVLTDQFPYDVNKVLPHEAMRVICDRPPRRPSTLVRALRGDLETIVLKALEKEPCWRYGSVTELREDVRRYLDGEPVRAHRNSGLYVLQKKLFKHRLAVAWVAAVLVLGLLGTTGGLWWRVRWLEHQRARALAEARLEVLDAMKRMWAGDTGNGYGIASRLLQQNPDLREARLATAQGLVRVPGGIGRHLALQELEGWLRNDPQNWECAALLGEIHRLAGDVKPADALAAVVARDMPDTAEAWYLRSLAALEVQPALGFARQAVARPGADVLAWDWFINLCWLGGDYEAIVQGADTLIEMGQDANRWGLARADALAHLDRFPEALAQYDALIARHTDDETEACLHRGHAWRRVGDYPKAIEDYTAAIRIAAERVQHRRPAASEFPAEFGPSARLGLALWAYFHRANVLWINGQTAAAIEDYQRIRPTLGRSFYGDARLYVLLRDEGRAAEAAEVLARAVADVARDDVWLKAIFSTLAGHLSPAALIAEAVNAGSRERQCEAYYYAGEIYRLDGASDQARECFEECLRTGVIYDPERPLEIMNEYELAGWRLRQLWAAQPAAVPPEHTRNSDE